MSTNHRTLLLFRGQPQGFQSVTDLQAQKPGVNELELRDIFDENFYKDPFEDLWMVDEADLWIADEDDYGQDDDFKDFTSRYSPRTSGIIRILQD